MNTRQGMHTAVAPTIDSREERLVSRPRSQPSRASGLTVGQPLKLHELAMLSLSPVLNSIHCWWLQRAERHYLMCADVEQQRAREAQANVAYYQKRAALARASRL